MVTVGQRQAACSAWPRAGARGGALACRPRCVRIFSITGCSRIAAMILSSPPQQSPPPQSGQSNKLLDHRRPARWRLHAPARQGPQVAIDPAVEVHSGRDTRLASAEPGVARRAHHRRDRRRQRWNNSAATSRARRWPTSAYKPTPRVRWCSAARGLTIATQHRSGDPAPRAAGIACVCASQDRSNGARSSG